MYYSYECYEVMWWLILVMGAPPLCTPNVYAVCKQGYKVVTANANETHLYSDCLRCHGTNCSAPIPPSNSKCYPTTKSCAICGTPQISNIGKDYSLFVQPHCNADCSGSVTFNSTLTLQNSNGLSITGSNQVLIGPCPVLSFVNALDVSIDGLIIECTSSTPVGAAILFSYSETLVFRVGMVHPLVFSGYCRTGVLVDGGQFDRAIMSTNLQGSEIGALSFSSSLYRQTIAVALANFVGIVNASTALEYTLLFIQPSAPGSGLVYPPSKLLRIINFGIYNGNRDVVYETEVYNKDIYGWSSQVNLEENSSLASTLTITGVIGCVLLVFGIDSALD